MVAGVKAEPLTAEGYAPFGEIVDLGRTQLYCGDGQYYTERLTMERLNGPVRRMNRHFDCHQLFVPLGRQPFVIVVAAPYVDQNKLAPEHVRAFLTDGTQAFTFHVGTWHIGPRPTKAQTLTLINVQGQRSNEYHTEYADVGEVAIEY